MTGRCLQCGAPATCAVRNPTSGEVEAYCSPHIVFYYEVPGAGAGSAESPTVGSSAAAGAPDGVTAPAPVPVEAEVAGSAGSPPREVILGSASVSASTTTCRRPSRYVTVNTRGAT